MTDVHAPAKFEKFDAQRYVEPVNNYPFIVYFLFYPYSILIESFCSAGALPWTRSL